jgi:hypothetical protein
MPESGPSGFVRGAAVMYVPTAILTLTPTFSNGRPDCSEPASADSARGEP